ncbi:MAG: hypothetical protein IT370_30985 [Deltaproteobacteria bacterium]|nr:hypothetical protein [Deltaproteobacteria bacterium]
MVQPPKLTIVAAPTTVAVNEGAQATFMVTLSRAPTEGPVTINVSSADRTIVTANPSTLTFTANDFSTAQAVVVQGVNDLDTNNDTVLVGLTSSGLDTVNVRVDVTDDDQLTIITSPTTLTVQEPSTPGTNTGTINVRLSNAPAAAVTVNVASAMTGKLTVSPATLTFDSANFGTSQAVTVTPLADADIVSDTVNVTFSATVGTAMPMASVPVLIADKDVQGIAIAPSAITVAEGSTTPGTFTVRLNQMPSSNVTVNLASANTMAATIMGSSTLTFTSANFATPQTVSVLAVSDDNTQPEMTTINVTSAGLDPRSVTVNVTDDDSQRIVVNPTSLSVLEDGSTTFAVHLAFNPASTISVLIASSNTMKATTTPTSLTFNAANFATDQTVTVNGIDDADLANESVTLLLSSAGNAPSVTIPVGVTDNDLQTLVVTPTTLGVVEGATSTFTVRLGFQPAADVTVTTATSAAAVATALPASLTFTPANFAMPQTVTVSGTDDTDLTDNTARITVASTAVVTPVDVTINVMDNDRQGILANPTGLTLTEGMAPGTVQVSLNFAPSADTTVTVVSSNPTRLSATTGGPTTSTLLFTPANFATPQPVTLTVADDLDAIGFTATVTLTAPGINPDTVVNVTVNDDDTQRHLVTLSSQSPPAPPIIVLEEDPTGRTFTVALSAQPESNVIVSLAASTSNVLSISTALGTTLEFNTTNYAVPQTVTVRGLSDPNLTDEFVDILVSSPVAPTVTVPVRVQEDDLQDLVVTPPQFVCASTTPLVCPGVGMPIREDGTTGNQISIRLQFQPEGTKGVRVRSNNPSILINGQSMVDLLFTTTNYLIPQVLTLTTPTDNNLDQPADTTVTIGLCEAACASAIFSAVKTLSIDAIEDDVQAIVTSASTVAVGEGATSPFTVRMAFEPLALGTEVLSLATSDALAATVAAMTPPLSFDAGNYSTPQTVIVTGEQDADVLGETVTATISSSIAPTPPVDVTIRVTDDDAQAILLSPSNSTTLVEAPDSETFNVTLQQDPSGSLTVNLVSEDDTKVTVSPATLTFDSSNYMVGQPVIVTSVSDEDVRNEDIDITLSATGVMTDSVYNVIVLDDDDQGFVVPAGVTVDEEGTAPLNMHLAFSPTVDLEVTATITGGGVGEASVSGPLTFTAANYATDQAFTITGLADLDLDNEAGFVTLTVTSLQGTSPPEGTATITVPLSVIDDDRQTIIVGQSPALPFVNSVQEGGPDGSFTVALGHPPRGGANDNVLVSIQSPLSDHITITSSTTLAFTTANFSTPQTVTFRGVLDSDFLTQLGDVNLLIAESTDAPAGTFPDVTGTAAVRAIDRQITVLASQVYPGLFGGTEFTERANATFGFDNFLVTGHNGAGVYSVASDNRDLNGFTANPASIGDAGPDATTQVVDFNGTNYGVFAADGTGIRYTEMSPALVATNTSSFGTGNKEFSVTNDPTNSQYGVLYRGANDNLFFTRVPYAGGAASAPQLVTTADASPDRSPSVHFIGNSFTFNALPTPFLGLYTQTGGGLTCLRMNAQGVIVAGGGTATLNNNFAFYSSVWSGARAVTARQDASGLILQEIFLNDQNSSPACQFITQVLLRPADQYVNPPAIAYNGTEFAVAYDVQSGANSIIGVALYHPASGTITNHLFNAPSDVPGERPSISWARDRWILRYSSTAGVQVRAGSMAPPG